MRNLHHLRFTFSSFDAQLTKTMNVEGGREPARCIPLLVGSCRDSRLPTISGMQRVLGPA
eukprot:scaffold15948_cov43-Cyclotella_meneghiniana.AAC.1